MLMRRFFSSATIANPPARKFLITGALGQIGQSLVAGLAQRYPTDAIVTSDIRAPGPSLAAHPIYSSCALVDVTQAQMLEQLCVAEGITDIIHLSALLSATGEAMPQLAMKVNAEGTANVLEIARMHNCRVFSPSTIAAYGGFQSDAERHNVGELGSTKPITIYGVTKVYCEMLGEYYHRKYGVDFRSLRYPGIISADTLPGGGTTDYAVHAYRTAVLPATEAEDAEAQATGAGRVFRCNLGPNSRLPMMYMPDCLRATLDLIHAPDECLTRRVYNVGAMDFTPEELFASIAAEGVTLSTEYEVNPLLQSIADSWPASLDDSLARRDWGWEPEYDLRAMSRAMIDELEAQVADDVEIAAKKAAAASH